MQMPDNILALVVGVATVAVLYAVFSARPRTTPDTSGTASAKATSFHDFLPTANFLMVDNAGNITTLPFSSVKTAIDTAQASAVASAVASAKKHTDTKTYEAYTHAKRDVKHDIAIHGLDMKGGNNSQFGDTHFSFHADKKNYIRGDTRMDFNVLTVGGVAFTPQDMTQLRDFLNHKNDYVRKSGKYSMRTANMNHEHCIADERADKRNNDSWDNAKWLNLAGKYRKNEGKCLTVTFK